MPHHTSPQVMTVTGLVEASQLGITAPHEHLFIDFLAVSADKQDSHRSALDKRKLQPAGWDEPLSLKNYYEARRNPFLFKDTLQLADMDDAVEAAGEYKQSGGGCIVDVTPIGVGRNPMGLKEISLRTGLYVVMGTGFYVNDFLPPDVGGMSEQAICDTIVAEIENGVDGVKPGIIGEIGLTWPVHPNERKSLRAAAKAQAKTGYCLTIHPGRDSAAPLDAIRTVEQAGGDPSRTIIDHLDRTLFDDKDFIELARTGCYLEQDLFGWETSYYPMSEIDMPNDAIRVNRLVTLAERGYLDRLLVSLDIDTRSRLTRYGGEGYQHIVCNVVPIMSRKGFSASDIDRILKINPQRAIAFACRH
ncbi:MAG: phosphotriesterase [Parvibaculaceae bacterium]